MPTFYDPSYGFSGKSYGRSDRLSSLISPHSNYMPVAGAGGLADATSFSATPSASSSPASKASADGNGFLYSAMVLGLGSGVANAISDYGNAKSRGISLRGQAAMNEGNAELSELQAQNTLYQGMQQIGEVTRRAGAAKAAARSAMAARGVGLSSGTAANVLASSDVNKTIDMINAKRNAVQVAMGYRRQAGDLRASAQAQRIMASAADSSARMGLATSLISTAGQLAGMWYSGTSAGGR